MIITATESVTALIYLYLWLALPRSSWHSWFGSLQELHHIAIVVAALVVARGAARRQPWAIVAAVILAGYAGLPNLLSLGSLLPAIGAGLGFGPTLGLVLLLVGSFVQLGTLLYALRILARRQAAV